MQKALLKALEDLKTELSDARMRKFDKAPEEEKEESAEESTLESLMGEEPSEDDASELLSEDGAQASSEEPDELRDFLLGKKPVKEKKPGTAMMIALESSKSPFKGKTKPTKRM